jgi:23S rRNA (uracil1939-C5)-methyltransferase
MEVVTLRPSHLVVGGAALARDSTGRVVFVDGALPDETVSVELQAVKKDFARARVVEILEPSIDRTEPACEAWHRGCGGCDWQHIRPEAQLELKAEIVFEALSRMGRIHQPRMFLGASVQPWGYRTTVRLAVSAQGNVGFRSRRSHDVVEIDNCPVAHPIINEMIAAVRVVGDSEVILRVGIASQQATASSRRSGDILGLAEATGYGLQAVVHEDVAGVSLRVSSGSFFQASPQAGDLLVEAVGRAVADLDLSSATLVDAYGGIGLFAATVGRAAARVVVVEASASSCGDAVANLADRGADAAIVHVRMEDWSPEPAAVVIADPARSGLDKVGAARIAETGAPRIVLISCDPASLARDTVLLRALGYQHRYSEVLDLFPNTSHIEVVTVFEQDAHVR